MTSSTHAPTPDARATTPALVGDRLTLRYGKTEVVHGVSLTLQSGYVTALVGPNGSGKSTVLRSLARLHRTEAGEVRIGGDGQPERAVADLSSREFAREVTLFSLASGTPGTVGE